MKRYALLATLVVMSGACDRPASRADERGSQTASYDWRQHRDDTPEAQAAQREMGMLLGPLQLAREPEVRAEMRRLARMRQAGEITPHEYNRQAIDFMREWVKQNPQTLEQMRDSNPKRYEQLVRRLDELHKQHAR